MPANVSPTINEVIAPHVTWTAGDRLRLATFGFSVPGASGVPPPRAGGGAVRTSYGHRRRGPGPVA